MGDIKGCRANTLIGEPNYIPPEMHEGIGYSFEADFWSLGVLMFYMYFNSFPFGEELDSPLSVYEDIMAKELDLWDMTD